MTDSEIDIILEQYDRTEPDLQRRIVAQFVADRLALAMALEESVRLQSHYARLLNNFDGGYRHEFKDAQEWLGRLAEIKKIPHTPKL